MPLISERLYRFDEFEMDPSRRLLTRSGERVAVTPKSFEVLLYLVQHPRRVVLKEELLREVWPGSFVEESNLSQHVFWIRKALGDRAGRIATVPGRGYEFRGEVRGDDAPELPGPSDATQTAEVHLRVSTETTRSVFKETVFSEGHPVPRSPEVKITMRWAVIVAAVILMALAGWGVWRSKSRVSPADHHEVLLAAFANATPDRDLGSTLKTLLGIDLSQSPYLVVSTDDQVRDTLKLMDVPASTGITGGVAMEVCQRLNDQVVLSGQVASVGKAYVVGLVAVDCQSGRGVAQSKATTNSREGVVRAMDSAAAEVRQRLGEHLSLQRAAQHLLPEHTVSLEALRSFSQAMNMGVDIRAAVPLFRRAVELDPQFAWGLFELSDAYRFQGELGLSRQYLLQAYSMRDRLNDYQRSAVIDAYDDLTNVDSQKRLLDLQSWSALYPNQVVPLHKMVDVYKSLGRFEDAIAPARQALALQPNDPGSYVQMATALAQSGHTQEAKAVCNEAFRRKFDSVYMRLIIYGIAIQEHDKDTVAAEDAWARDKADGAYFPVWRLMGEGKAHEAVARGLENVEDLRRQGFQEHADRRLRFLMHRESLFQMKQEIAKQMKGVDIRMYPENLIFVLADSGRIRQAQMEMRMLEADDPEQANQNGCSEARAAVDAATHKLENAIRDLEPCRKYGMAAPEALIMRGLYYLDASRPELAEPEFRYLLDHSYATMGFLESIARLGLARAITRQGRKVEGRHAYEAVFVQWKEADPDLPLLVQAKQEYSKLAQD